jgi:hypothetical protein
MVKLTIICLLIVVKDIKIRIKIYVILYNLFLTAALEDDTSADE